MTLAPDPWNMSRNDLETASWDWKEVQGDLRIDPDLPFPRFSRYLEISHKQCVYIPRPLAKIAVSILQEVEKTYITGMELISEETKISMGYKIPGQQVTIDVKLLRGFEAAIGSGGIHALRIITDTNSTSIPESELFLNERSFMGEDPLIPGYRPLHWTLFGGPDGSDLRSLTGISVTLFDNQPFVMKFFYNKEWDSKRRALNLAIIRQKYLGAL
ncbi:hypothetical protein VTN77DRAFT_4027 [Rasamsonia byssochlamydoides]|uniref:uncharacterized protein n=1 Tax=Rasamsonia byssochlamydoides TaxID=89139 RepID=UPI003742FAF8